MNFPVGSNRYFVVPPQAQSTAGSANPPDSGEPKDATASPAQPTPSSSFVVPPEAQSSSPGGGASSDSVPPPGAPPVLTQHGGAVLTAPKVANLYLGNYWSSAAGQQDIQKNDTFSNEFGQSAMMGLAKEYGAGATQFLGSTVVGSSHTSRVTEADVQSTVKQAISSGAVKKDAQGLYNVVLPPDAVLDAGGGVTSKQGLGGFHGSFDDGTGKPVYYSVIAYSDAKGNGINFDGSSQDAVGITESHEWMEAMTDPDVNSPIAGRGLAWYDDRDNGEIGDLAINTTGSLQEHSLPASGWMSG